MLRDHVDVEKPEYAQASSEKRETEEFNKFQIAIICVGEVLEGIHITMPYSIASYMVRDFLRESSATGTVDEELVGTLTGVLASIFCLSQFVTSYFWGLFSDRYGRKGVLMLSIASGAVSAIMFGIGGSYTTAALARLFGGLLNATGGIVKTMLAEKCGKQLPKAMGYLGLAWGLGSMLGPMIGGAFANPCTVFGPSFPACGEGQIFRIRPYFLPCLVAAVVAVITLILSIIYVDETLPSLQKVSTKKAGVVELQERSQDKEERARLLAAKQRRPSARSYLDWETGPDNISDSTSSEGDHRGEDGETDMELHVPAHSTDDDAYLGDVPHSEHFGMRAAPGQEGQPLSDISNTSKIGADWGSGKHDAGHWTPELLSCPAVTGPILGPSVPAGVATGNLVAPYSHYDALEANESASSRGDEEEGFASSEKARLRVPWYKDFQVLLALGTYMIVAFLFNLLDEVRPVFASAPVEVGGLGLSTNVLSWPLSFGGLCFILFACLGYESLYKAVGGVWCSRLGMIVFVPVALLVPVASLLPSTHAAVLPVLFLGMAVNSVADLAAYSGSNVLINAAASREEIGQVNGAGQAITALARSFGPFLGGYSWGLSITAGFPGHQFLVFIAISAVAFVSQFLYAFVDLPGLDS
ncbi:g5700 [Coccomyxa viridis]|uniref:G5700 protein n=1 Tax=Coccomyxa viridis TaxID=1274662 RepID=A0ABP1FTJ6_9CHLO